MNRIKRRTPLKLVADCRNTEDSDRLYQQFSKLSHIAKHEMFSVGHLRELVGLSDTAEDISMPVGKWNPAPNRDLALNVASLMGHMNGWRPNMFSYNEMREIVAHGVGITDPIDHVVRRNIRELLAAYVDNPGDLWARARVINQVIRYEILSVSEIRFVFGLSDSAAAVFLSEREGQKPKEHCGIASSMLRLNEMRETPDCFTEEEIVAVVRWEFGLGLPPA